MSAGIIGLRGGAALATGVYVNGSAAEAMARDKVIARIARDPFDSLA